MKILANNGRYLRPMKMRDLAGYAESMEDWPTDGDGPFTLQRSVSVLSRRIESNKLIHWPMTPESKFTLTFAFCEPDDTFIGYWCAKIADNICYISQQAVHPDFRGKGLSKEMQYSRQYFVHDILKAPVCCFEIMTETSPETVQGTSRYVKGDLGERQGITKQRLTMHSITWDDYEVFIKSPAAARDREFTHIFDPEI